MEGVGIQRFWKKHCGVDIADTYTPWFEGVVGRHISTLVWLICSGNITSIIDVTYITCWGLNSWSDLFPLSHALLVQPLANPLAAASTYFSFGCFDFPSPSFSQAFIWLFPCIMHWSYIWMWFIVICSYTELHIFVWKTTFIAFQTHSLVKTQNS